MVSNIEYEVDVRDVEYQRQAGKAWLARIYQPKGTGPFPTIVDVHGGAWSNKASDLTISTIFGPTTRELALVKFLFAELNDRSSYSVVLASSSGI